MQQYTRFLRLFGASAAELTPLLKAAAAQGCPGLRLLQKDGECVICISAPGQDNRAVLLTDRWADQIREKLGPEFYGEGPTSLASAAADALAGKGKLMVACEAYTILGNTAGPTGIRPPRSRPGGAARGWQPRRTGPGQP